jgi:hypothetical protein
MLTFLTAAAVVLAVLVVGAIAVVGVVLWIASSIDWRY